MRTICNVIAANPGWFVAEVMYEDDIVRSNPKVHYEPVIGWQIETVEGDPFKDIFSEAIPITSNEGSRPNTAIRRPDGSIFIPCLGPLSMTERRFIEYELSKDANPLRGNAEKKPHDQRHPDTPSTKKDQ